MSKSIEEIKEQYAKDFERDSFEDMIWSYAESENGINDFIMIVDEVAERYAQSKTETIKHLAGVNSELKKQTQELQEHNAELVFVLQNIVNMLEVDAKISVESIRRVLTKYQKP